ncbi:PREDICTED: zinc finger and SCAN domain-containing protein 31-like isoform X2 [Acromyrmex echinatior]|uniref:zinc finger and SCAN domain-containing protein 31-like isoform X2 n=1 Tax=Acromyrmex echinatior TaxID=103372 RepID=UPI000580D17E|nr:PREDICTED: zinc finger and SCAN domain-containing protein 31-like isoform X2 [Acromyrmex echinatior]XP_011051570.1 PREDICTED: zinc finger and SCAN domain-containing protein 31-like isoform X2 [Acromyrmex echinatior]
MAYDPRNVKYSPNTSQRPNVVGYNYSGHPPQHFQQTDENRNENNNLRSSKELCPQISQQSSSTQTVQKVDAATMTDPLQIDFRLSECLARCSSTLGLPYATKYEDCGTNSTYQEVRAKIEFDIEPQHINGMLVYHCPECAYRFNDREALHEHLEDHKQRPHICDICGASLKRKEHLDRHKQEEKKAHKRNKWHSRSSNTINTFAYDTDKLYLFLLAFDFLKKIKKLH